MNDKATAPQTGALVESDETQQLPTLPEAGEVTPMDLLVQAQRSGAPPELLEKYMDLHDRWQKDEARKKFIAALARFNKNPPTIYKDATVDFTHNNRRTYYRHASLGQITTKVKEALAKVGISHRWDVVQQDTGRIDVTCILTHTAGHEERVTMYSPPDTSGNKNSIQAVASTTSYLERYTLQAATGVAILDDDDDGRAASSSAPEISAPASNTGRFTDSQIRIMRAKLDDAGLTERDLLHHFEADTMADLDAARINDYLSWIQNVNAPE